MTLPTALVASPGVSRMYRADSAQLGAAMLLCDTVHLWCREATGETRDLPAAKPTRAGK